MYIVKLCRSRRFIRSRKENLRIVQGWVFMCGQLVGTAKSLPFSPRSHTARSSGDLDYLLSLDERVLGTCQAAGSSGSRDLAQKTINYIYKYALPALFRSPTKHVIWRNPSPYSQDVYVHAREVTLLLIL